MSRGAAPMSSVTLLASFGRGCSAASSPGSCSSVAGAIARSGEDCCRLPAAQVGAAVHGLGLSAAACNGARTELTE